MVLDSYQQQKVNLRVATQLNNLRRSLDGMKFYENPWHFWIRRQIPRRPIKRQILSCASKSRKISCKIFHVKKYLIFWICPQSPVRDCGLPEDSGTQMRTDGKGVEEGGDLSHFGWIRIIDGPAFIPNAITTDAFLPERKKNYWNDINNSKILYILFYTVFLHSVTSLMCSR